MHADRRHGLGRAREVFGGAGATTDVISVRAADGTEIARGLANYASGEARLIARKPSSQIAGLLGFANEPELIHRDNMIVLALAGLATLKLR